MPKFRRRPVVVEAEKIVQGMQGDLMSEAIGAGKARSTEEYFFLVRTPEGERIAVSGDWLIKGANGNFHVCRGSDFETTYDPVDPIIHHPV